MTLRERYAALAPEKLEKFQAVKDEAGLDAFLAELGAKLTPEERDAALKYISAEETPLLDEDLENVAGGCGGGPLTPKERARKEGRTVNVQNYSIYDKKYWYRCPKCEEMDMTFAFNCRNVSHSELVHGPATIFESCKCYNNGCGNQFTALHWSYELHYALVP